MSQQPVELANVTTAEVAAAGHDWQLIGKRALTGLTLAAAIGTPIARSINSVENMPATRVPMTIAGSDVDVKLVPGNDTLELDALGHAFIHPSTIHFGRKTVGVSVVFHTEDVSLSKSDGSPDMAKVDAIVRKFSDPTPQEHEIEQALKHDIEHRAVKTAGETVGIELVLAGLYIARRRQKKFYDPAQLQLTARDRRLPTIAATAALSLIAGSSIAQAGNLYLSANRHQPVVADQAFKGTPVQGWEVRGPFASAIDLSWHQLNKISSDKNKYYSAVDATFKQQFMAKYGVDQLAKVDGVRRILFADDFQGIDGMTQIVGSAAKAYSADVIALGGDTEDSDTPFVSVLDGLSDHAKGIPIVMGTGAHDPSTIARLAKEHGFSIGDDSIQTVAGLSFLAVADASSLDAFAANKQLVNKGVTDTQVTQSVITEACAADKPLIVLAHDHAVGTPVAEAGCPAVADVLQGRSYFPPAPVDEATNELITSGSTGGHNFGEGINLDGIISGKASFQIVEVDAKTLQFISTTIVTVDPVPKFGGDTSTPNTTVIIADPIVRATKKTFAAVGKPRS